MSSASDVLAALQRVKDCIHEVNELDALKAVQIQHAAAIDTLAKFCITTSRPRSSAEAESASFERAFRATGRRTIDHRNNPFTSSNYIPGPSEARDIPSLSEACDIPQPHTNGPRAEPLVLPRGTDIQHLTARGLTSLEELAASQKMAGGNAESFNRALKSVYRAARGE